MAYEGRLRAGEVTNLRIGDMQFDQLGAVVVVRGKTGTRRVRLIESVPDLQHWLTVHPRKGDPSAPLWPSRDGGTLTQKGFWSLLKRVAEKAGILKRIHPHLLRHTRATHLAKVLTEDQMRVYFGWSKTSQVPARYVHLSGRDVDGTLAGYYDLSGKNGRTACPRCGFLAPEGSFYCPRCSFLLSETEAVRLERFRIKTEEIAKRLVKKLLEEYPELLEKTLNEAAVAEELEELKENSPHPPAHSSNISS